MEENINFLIDQKEKDFMAEYRRVLEYDRELQAQYETAKNTCR